MKRLLTTLATGLTLVGCEASFPTVASVELRSLIQFSTYPGATLIEETVAQGGFGGLGGLGGLGIRGNHAYVRYETTDAPEQIRAHYQGLATQPGWQFATNAESPVDTRHSGPLAMLSHDRFTVDVWVFPEQVASGDASTPHSGPWVIRLGPSVNAH